MLWHTGTHGARNRLILRRNGALVVENGHGDTVWSAHTHAAFLADGSTLPPGAILDSRYPSWYHGPSEWLRMQRDGDLVLRCDQKLIWSSGTHAAGSSLTLLRDGNLVVRSGDGRTVWRSHTRGTGPYTYLAGNGLVLFSHRGRIIWDPPKRHSPCDP
jgi:hypothetical protein